MSTIQYQTLVYAAGQQFICVESYESIFERMRESAFRITPDSDDDDAGSMRWAAPLELTVQGNHGPLRLALNATTLSGVLELDTEDRVEVDGA